MNADAWPDTGTGRKNAAFEAAESGIACIPLSPLSPVAVLQNTVRSVLLSSPTPDQAMLAAVLYAVGPMSIAEASRMIGRKLQIDDDFLSFGIVSVKADAKTSIRQAVMRLVGSWSSETLAKRTRSPRPPSVPEMRQTVTWAIGYVKRRKAEADGELFVMLRWIKQSCHGHAAKPIPRADLLRAAAAKKALDQLQDWIDKDAADGKPTPESLPIIQRWLSWALMEHTYLPEFIPPWPEE